jgi:TPP-dependent pyruvate/acetoin dehydrogenase alpha subunit
MPQTEMLKQVQHDRVGKTFGFCHPEPGPEASNVILNLFQDQDLTISGSRF